MKNPSPENLGGLVPYQGMAPKVIKTAHLHWLDGWTVKMCGSKFYSESSIFSGGILNRVLIFAWQ